MNVRGTAGGEQSDFDELQLSDVWRRRKPRENKKLTKTKLGGG